jgi:hypothetical protein
MHSGALPELERREGNDKLFKQVTASVGWMGISLDATKQKEFIKVVKDATNAQLSYKEAGRTVLMELAEVRDWPEAVAALIAKCEEQVTVVGKCNLNACNVNARDNPKAPRKSGFTALQYAFDKKNKKTARKLIELGAEDGLFEAVQEKRYQAKRNGTRRVVAF